VHLTEKLSEEANKIKMTYEESNGHVTRDRWCRDTEWSRSSLQYA